MALGMLAPVHAQQSPFQKWLNEDVFWIQIRDSGGTAYSLEKAALTKLERQLDATLMPSYATRLSSSDLDDLVAYLATLRGAR